MASLNNRGCRFAPDLEIYVGGGHNLFSLVLKIFLHAPSLTIRFSPCQGLSCLLLRWPPGMHFLLLSLERFVFSGSSRRGREWAAACADAQQEEMLHPGSGNGMANRPFGNTEVCTAVTGDVIRVGQSSGYARKAVQRFLEVGRGNYLYAKHIIEGSQHWRQCCSPTGVVLFWTG